MIAAQIQLGDITGTLLHLVSDGARFITGQTIVVDGGKYFPGYRRHRQSMFTRTPAWAS